LKIPLVAWAATRYNPAPSRWVLRQWVRRGEIYPTPELVGKEYYVDEKATRLTSNMNDEDRLVRRMEAVSS
jgi:predicted site-specific integrase-resolvase